MDENNLLHTRIDDEQAQTILERLNGENERAFYLFQTQSTYNIH